MTRMRGAPWSPSPLRHPSPTRSSTWCRAAASAVTCAIWQPVTKPAETPVGQAEQLAQPCERDLLDDAGARRRSTYEAGVLIPGRGEPVGRKRSRQRAADDEAEDSGRLGIAMTPGSAAAMSSATTCVSSSPCSGQRAAERGAQLLDRGARSNRPLVERAEELRRVVGGEAEQVLHGVHNAPR